MNRPLSGAARVLAVGLLLSQSGCAFFGTGPEDSRIFVARYEPRFLDPDRDYPSDPHSLAGYAIADASEVSHPVIVGAGFDTRDELHVLVRDREINVVSTFRFRTRGNPVGRREMDSPHHIEVALYDAIVTGSGTLVAAGRTEALFGPSPRTQIDFLVVGTTTTGSAIPTFGRDGRVQTAFPGLTTAGAFPTCCIAYHAAASPTGGFYVAGEYSTDITCRPDTSSAFAIAKYMDSGELDARFSRDGKQISVLAGATTVDISSIASDATGKLILSGVLNSRDGTSRHVVGRWLTDGRPDRTFGTDGWRTLDASSASERIIGLVPFNEFVFLALNTGMVRVLRSDGRDHDGFGRPIAGTSRRTGSITVAGQPESLLSTDNAFYVLSQRENTTYLTKYSLTGEEERQRRVGVSTPLYPDSDFLGQALLSHGGYIYVAGIIE